MALNVLIVDDSVVMRDIIKKTLGLSNLPIARIYEAGDGREGLEQLQANWIDLALIDIHMPVMNGEAMLDAIRSNPETQDLAVIIVSSESNANRIEMLEEQGAGFVHKPFAPESLREVVLAKVGELSDDPAA